MVLMRNYFEQTDAGTNGCPGWFLRFMGLARLLGVMCLFAQLNSPVQAAQSVTLAWDPSPDSTVVGYSIYSGVASGTYTNKVDVGNATSGTIFGLVERVTYFFAVCAYDANGLESDFSNELSFTVPGGDSTLQIHAVTGGQFVLPVTGPAGHTYDIEATEHFTAWTVIGTVTLGPSGSTDFTDTNAASFPKRFYRSHQKP
jgi:hypothetical protein